MESVRVLCEVICFNPRPHAGGDKRSELCMHLFILFQSTPPRGGRRPRGPPPAYRDGFNPRPHAGGDSLSNHRINVLPRVSIHAPTRGATIRRIIQFYGSMSFNPRPHAGGDVQGRTLYSEPRCVSIHAPTRGATRSRAILFVLRHVSIHAPTRGAT